MDASSRGWLKVEILDTSGHTLWGYSKAEADRLMFNDIAQGVTWDGSGNPHHCVAGTYGCATSVSREALRFSVR